MKIYIDLTHKIPDYNRKYLEFNDIENFEVGERTGNLYFTVLFSSCKRDYVIPKKYILYYYIETSTNSNKRSNISKEE